MSYKKDMSYKKKENIETKMVEATPATGEPSEPAQLVKPSEPATPAQPDVPPFLSQRFLFKIGATIKMFHTFLENVNANQFLSDAYYYYNVVSHSERGFECVQAKACHARIIDTYYSKGMISDSYVAGETVGGRTVRSTYGAIPILIKDPSSDKETGTLRPITHMELMEAFGYQDEKKKGNVTNGASVASVAGEADQFVFEFLPPKLSNFSAAPRSSSKFNGIQEFLSGMKILKMTMKTISLFKIENWLKV